MSKPDTYGQAFPTTEDNGVNSGAPGMTLRDYFAAKAIPFVQWNNDAGLCATRCWEIADAMLEARK